jgi:hypothetical protein
MAIKDQTGTNFPSILGEKSNLFCTKTQEGGGILDVPSAGTLEFYCAGYTKPDDHGTNRQEWHQRIYAESVKRDTEDRLMPLPMEEYQINFIHDKDNKFDINRAALKIILTPLSMELKKVFSCRVDLGFVPQRINASVLKNQSMINNIKILKTRESFHDKYYTTKLIVAYGHNRLGLKDIQNALRFCDMLDEIE